MNSIYILVLRRGHRDSIHELIRWLTLCLPRHKMERKEEIQKQESWVNQAEGQILNQETEVHQNTLKSQVDPWKT